MTNQTPVSATNPHPFMTAPWLYDEIMQHIDRDLLTSNIPLLDAELKNATPEERAERLAVCDESFDIFDLSLSDVDEQMREDVINWKRQMNDQLQKISAAQESEQIQSIEKSFDDNAL